mgnify:CR=1 FL=1
MPRVRYCAPTAFLIEAQPTSLRTSLPPQSLHPRAQWPSSFPAAAELGRQFESRVRAVALVESVRAAASLDVTEESIRGIQDFLLEQAQACYRPPTVCHAPRPRHLLAVAWSTIGLLWPPNSARSLHRPPWSC